MVNPQTNKHASNLKSEHIINVSYICLYICNYLGRKRRPCPGSSISSCTCKDGNSVENPRECGSWKNKPTTCTCADGTTWTPPARPSRPSPCSDSNPPVSCTCKDDTEVEKPWECGRGNWPKFCTCSDGEQVTKRTGRGGRGGGRRG